MDEKFWEKINGFGENGEFDKIVREIKKLPEEKIDLELVNVLGIAYTNLGDIDNALDTYLSYIGKDKKDVVNADIWLYSQLGWLCDDIGDFEQGLKYLFEAEKLGRNDEWLNTEIGQCLGRLGRAEEGIERLKKSLKLIKEEAPENVSEEIFINSELGYLYGFLGNYEEALKYFNIAKKLGRDDEWLYTHIYTCVANLENKDEFVEYYEKAIKDNEGDSLSWAILGQIYMYLFENYEKAEKYFRKAFGLTGNGLYLFNRGIALRNLNKYEEAVEVLLTSRKISEQEGDVTDGEDLELVRCYIALKDKDNAEKYLQSAREGIENVNEDYLENFEADLKALEDLIAQI